MSATADLIAEMIKALEDYNAGKVSVSMEGYHIIVCTGEAYNVMDEAYDEWATEEGYADVRMKNDEI